MIFPILNYNAKGAIWYQGESNAANAYKYRDMQPAMIGNSRMDFKNPNLAFHFVQLAPFNATPKKPGESNWAELREAQNLSLKLKNTGVAVITDFGDEGDIHPSPKRPVGERLALAARATTYGEKIVYSGPMYKSVKFDGASRPESITSAAVWSRKAIFTANTQQGEESVHVSRPGRFRARRRRHGVCDLRQGQGVPWLRVYRRRHGRCHE